MWESKQLYEVTSLCFLTLYFHSALQPHPSEQRWFRILLSEWWVTGLLLSFTPCSKKENCALRSTGKEQSGQGLWVICVRCTDAMFISTCIDNRHSWIPSSVLGAGEMIRWVWLPFWRREGKELPTYCLLWAWHLNSYSNPFEVRVTIPSLNRDWNSESSEVCSKILEEGSEDKAADGPATILLYLLRETHVPWGRDTQIMTHAERNVWIVNPVVCEGQQ